MSAREENRARNQQHGPAPYGRIVTIGKKYGLGAIHTIANPNEATPIPQYDAGSRLVSFSFGGLLRNMKMAANTIQHAITP